MGMVIILANGPNDPAKGWAGPWALFVAAVFCYLVWRADKYYRARWGGGATPSPTVTTPPPPGETVQVRAVSSQVSPDETPVEANKTHWYGSIERVRGEIKRVYRGAQHVARTGDSPPPDDEVPDDEVDLPLEDVSDETQEQGETALESREEYIVRCLAAGVGKPQLVAALQEHYGRSRAQAYRDVEAAPRRNRAA